MCFSNLPIEFDDEGNPYLADEADEVDDPGNHDHDECTSESGDSPALDADPEAAYAEILADVPRSVREELTDGQTTGESDRGDRRESVGGD